MGSACSDCFGNGDAVNGGVHDSASASSAGGVGRGSSTAPNTSAALVSAAVKSIVEDILSCNESKIPTFDWRFRRGFGNVVIGSQGATDIVNALIAAGRSNRVTVIELQGQDIGDSGAVCIARFLSTDTILSSLNLSRNNISDIGGTPLGEALATNRGLRRLVIEDNPLGSAGIASIAKSVAAAPCGIAHLDLGVTDTQKLDDSAVIALGNMLRTATALKHFKFSGAGANVNSCAALSAASLSSLVEQLAENRTLEELSFVNCISAASLDPRDSERTMVKPCRTLAQYLQSAACPLRMLELRLPIGDAGASTIALGLTGTGGLQSLSLSKCGIGNEGIQAIAKALAKNRSLTRLDLSCQKTESASHSLDVQAALSLAQMLTSNSTLMELNILELPFTDEVAEAFCTSITNGVCALHAMRHGAVQSDVIATRLANGLVTNEATLAAKRRTPPSSVPPAAHATVTSPDPAARSRSDVHPPDVGNSDRKSLLNLIPSNANAPFINEDELVELEM